MILDFLRKKDSDMTEGVIWRQLLEFSIPMAIGLLFQQLYNTVDTIVVGHYVGKEALAAVGSVGSIVNMLVGLCTGLSMGANVIISQHYGAHDHDKLSDAVQTTICVTFLIGLIATGAGILIVDPMLHFMDTPSDVFGEAHTYLTIYFCGMLGQVMYNMGSGILRAVGDSQRPLYFLIFSAAVNTTLDLIFVIAFRLGVAGVAVATIMSQFMSATLVLTVLTKTKAPYRIRWDKLKIKAEPLKRIINIGMPSGVQQAITAFSNVFVQSYINYFGSTCMAGWSGYNKIDVYVLIPIQSIALASTTFVGQNYGARKLGRAKKGVRQSLTLSLIITAILSSFIMIIAPYAMRLFTSDEGIIEYGAFFIRLISPFYLLTCFNQILAGALRGIGRARAPMVVMLSSFVLFRQIYLFIVKRLGGGIAPIALGYPLGWIVCSTIMIILYLRCEIARAEIAAE